ncbi:MAG: signal transduction histidine kinase/DNA-binding response OmpR family regulator [Parvicella sp.]|jgi:signal transduction histidine kinase/DNA-binding response OmpR family regulator
MNSRIILFSIWVFFPLLAYSQDDFIPQYADPMLEEWRYAFFPELDGKGVRSIASISETQEYWFGLDSGVVSYDGYDWKYYSQNEEFSGGAVQQVFVDANQNIYASTSHGLFKFVDENWIGIFNTNGSLTLEFRNITQLQSGTIVCSTNAGAIFLTDEKITLLSTQESWQTFSQVFPNFNFIEIPILLFQNNGFTDFTDVFEVFEGQLWMAITYSLNEDEKGDILMLSELEILTGNITNYNLLSNYYSIQLGQDQQIFRTSKDHIWIINKSNKLPALRYAENKWEQIEYGKQFGDDEYSENILETSNGKIWVSGVGNIYSLDDKNTWTKYSSQKLNIPQGHMILHSGNHSELWVIGVQSSVYRVDLSSDKWMTLLDLNYQCEQSNGTKLFLDFDGNIISNNKNEWKKNKKTQGVIDHAVGLFVDSNDVLWAIGSHQGIASAGHYLNKSWTNLIFDSLSWGIDYRAIHESIDGSIWLGSSTDRYANMGQVGGLIQIKNPYQADREIIPYSPNNKGLTHSNAYGIAETKDHKIWVGGSSLCYFDGDQWTYMEDPDLNDFVNEIYSNQKGILYVGSRQHGLYIKKDNQWTNYSIQNGLSSNNIISIATDNKNGEIWLATDKDFSFFNGQHWSNDIFPKELTFSYEGGTIRLTNNNELWVSKSPREWKRRAYTGRAPEGMIRNQFISYRFVRDDTPPETLIEVYSETVDHSGNTSVFWTGKHYFNKVSSSDLFFSYQLNDQPWSEFSKSTNHTFTGLMDGDYTLKVRSMDKEGNIDLTPAIAEFMVTPPVWKQAWFIILMSSFLLVLGYFQFQIIKKREMLERLNTSLQSANSELENRNQEVQQQKDSLEELVKKIDELSKAKVRFFTNITHEFRTPLSLILGPIEKLSAEVPNNSPLFNFYNLIKRNALRLQRLINQLLEVRRIESGTLELILNNTDIVGFVKEVKELFNNQAIDKNIQFSFYSDIEHFTIYFDQDKIEKILFNLLSNAFKHTPENGKITVKIKTSQNSDNGTSDSSSAHFIKLIVEDNGTGLDEEVRDHIFDRFAVGHNEVGERTNESSGIGLSYIKDLIEFHKGKIEVKSEPDKGCKFIVFLPDDLEGESKPENNHNQQELHPAFSIDASILASESERITLKKTTKPEMERQTILVVEDNPDMRLFLRNLLNDNFNILTAKNGQEGLETLENEYVELIISDIMMPKVDGITFCQKAKSNPVTSHIPIILLTALAIDDKRISGYESGADSYIVKPFAPELLMARISNLIASRENLKEVFSKDLRFKPKDIKVNSVDENFMDKLASMMEDNISDSQFDVTKMCEMANMSHMHFIRKVKQLTGKKPIDLLKSFRLSRAKQLLEQNKINISEVGYMVGYDLPNSFTRAFKNEYGMSPSNFISQDKSISNSEV